MSEQLPSSEAHSVDLIALRSWHWRASMDAGRDHEMRSWHRQQVRWIQIRISAHRTEKSTTDFEVLVEMMADEAYHQFHREIQTICAGDWEKNCQLAREAIVAKLKAHAPFKDLV